MGWKGRFCSKKVGTAGSSGCQRQRLLTETAAKAVQATGDLESLCLTLDFAQTFVLGHLWLKKKN